MALPCGDFARRRATQHAPRPSARARARAAAVGRAALPARVFARSRRLTRVRISAGGRGTQPPPAVVFWTRVTPRGWHRTLHGPPRNDARLHLPLSSTNRDRPTTRDQSRRSPHRLAMAALCATVPHHPALAPPRAVRRSPRRPRRPTSHYITGHYITLHDMT